MRWSYNQDRSRAVAAWLFLVAAMIVAMVVVGGATRLTGSGLSITEWRPITGVVPPLSARGWAQAFAEYRRIPQFRYLNPDMTLPQFKGIYAWEWAHRLLGRLIGAAVIVPLAVFLARRRVPRRLVWRCWALLGLGALQGLVGWWMVASGLTRRVYVAPERLAAHLGLALALFAFAVWTGWEAWSGKGRPVWATPPRWIAAGAVLTGLVFVQILQGALVAGNHAGQIDTDWPLMDGRWVPAGYVAGGPVATLLHSAPAVQFNHRMTAYLILLLTGAMAARALASKRLSGAVKLTAAATFGVVTLQVGLGVVTLMLAAPAWLGIVHQLWAVATFTAGLYLVWRMRRS